MGLVMSLYPSGKEEGGSNEIKKVKKDPGIYIGRSYLNFLD